MTLVVCAIYKSSSLLSKYFLKIVHHHDVLALDLTFVCLRFNYSNNEVGKRENAFRFVGYLKVTFC